MSKPAYRTLTWSSYSAALRRRGSLTVWFDPSTPWHAAPSGKRGAQPVYSDAAIQACLTTAPIRDHALHDPVGRRARHHAVMSREGVKVLFGLTLRQTTGFVASLLKLAGLDWPVPDFSTLSRRQKTLAVQLPDRGLSGPLHLLVDSTGIKARGEGEWHTRKHGGAKHRVWRKIHLAIDEATMEVRAVEVTDSRVGDAPMLPCLLSQIPADEPVASVIADGAYDGRACRDAIALRGAEAVAIVLEPMAHKARSRPDGTPRPGRRTVQAPGAATMTCAP